MTATDRLERIAAELLTAELLAERFGPNPRRVVSDAERQQRNTRRRKTKTQAKPAGQRPTGTGWPEVTP